MFRNGHGLGVVAAIVVVLAFGGSLLAGAPKTLPDVALDWSLLFHVERTVVVVLAFLVLLSVVARAWVGELPIEITSERIEVRSPRGTR